MGESSSTHGRVYGNMRNFVVSRAVEWSDVSDLIMMLPRPHLAARADYI
jgi:hypothetical protein